MSSSTVSILVLCLALFGSGEAGFFDGCFDEADQNRGRDSCVFVPKEWLESETYRNLAHMALTNATLRPDGTHRNTLFEVTRAANQVSNGIVTRVEFTTVESFCSSSDVYSKEACPPRSSMPNGVCQARLRYTRSLELEDVVCEQGILPKFKAILY